jgi:DNA-binding transcriptional regulator YiaG
MGGHPVTEKNHFLRPDKPLNAEPLHYTACGLDDVYLHNGFERVETDYGPGVTIEKLDDLLSAIALHLVARKKRLDGKELRFLRRQLDMTQNELAGLLGVDGQTVARYEKGESRIDGPAQLAIRAVYLLYSIEEEKRLEILKSVRELIETDEFMSPETTTFAITDEGWREAA